MSFINRKSPLVLGVVALTLLAAACSDDEDTTTTSAATGDPVAAAEARVTAAEDGVTQSQEALTTTHDTFCDSTTDYIDALDRYGHVFTDSAATVGDIQTLGADLVAPQDEVVAAADAVDGAKTDLAAAQQELVDAQAALAAAIATASSVPDTAEPPATSTTTTLVSEATIERVQQAEDDLARVSSGITAETPLADATADYNSAALALEISWLQLLNQAACLTDDQQATAVEQLTAYTTALQTDLTTAGYDPGPIDGIYGPATVAAVEQLQEDSDLPVTGFVDEATSLALQEKLAAAGQVQATQTVAVQTILAVAGFWDGPIDGVWTEDLTQALMDFQVALGVPPTGVVDAATIAAFQAAKSGLEPGAPPTTEAAPDETTAPPSESTAAPAPDAEETVFVADSALGPILAAGDGLTVYAFMPDAQGEPTCIDACADAWPPLTVTDASLLTPGEGIDETLLATVVHPNGDTQVTYNGWPLYVFSGDSVPGDVNGQGQGGVWYVLDPAGEPIES